MKKKICPHCGGEMRKVLPPGWGAEPRFVCKCKKEISPRDPAMGRVPEEFSRLQVQSRGPHWGPDWFKL